MNKKAVMTGSQQFNGDVFENIGIQISIIK